MASPLFWPSSATPAEAMRAKAERPARRIKVAQRERARAPLLLRLSGSEQVRSTGLIIGCKRFSTIGDSHGRAPGAIAERQPRDVPGEDQVTATNSRRIPPLARMGYVSRRLLALHPRGRIMRQLAGAFEVQFALD